VGSINILVRSGPDTHVRKELGLTVRARSLPPDPGSSREAREFLREVAAERLSPGTLDTALLLMSELASNAIRHAETPDGEPIEVTVRIEDPRSIRVAVRDAGAGFDPDDLPARDNDGGWGLHLLRSLSSDWGITREASGTEVWFEL
jgi:anti-sigma regulatory factor (Ser/Thr protein kinase)